MKEEKKAAPPTPPFLHLLQYGTVAGNEVLQLYTSRSVLCGGGFLLWVVFSLCFVLFFFLISSGECHYSALSSNLEATNLRHGKDIM